MSEHQRLDDLRRRVQKDPASIAFAQLAEELRRAGHSQESVEVCRAGLAIHPGYLSARMTLGRALLDLGQLDDALAELKLVLAGAPDNLSAIRGIAEIHHKRGALVEALTYYRAALGRARNDPELEQTVADLTRQVAPAQAAALPGLSLEQLEQELALPATPVLAPRVAAPRGILEPAAVAATSRSIGTAPVRPHAETASTTAYLAAPSDAATERSVRTMAALEQWLKAIHGTRADRRA